MMIGSLGFASSENKDLRGLWCGSGAMDSLIEKNVRELRARFSGHNAQSGIAKRAGGLGISTELGTDTA